jgi:ATP-dependent RNA helicase DeaD
MGRLRSGTAELLVATDVAARGLDVEHLSHVVNYEVPSAPDSYVHRIGRVGRAGREGVAITIAEPREHRMLKTIERATGQRIPIERLPTVADLHARRLELTRVALQELLIEDHLDPYRVVVETLTDDFDVVQVALAAVRLAHEALGGGIDDTEEIPSAAVPRQLERPDRGGSAGRAERGPRRSSRSRDDVARVFLAVGRSAGVRPQDLVGAIANESPISGRDIGEIQIADRFSLVEVPADAVDDVIAALRKTTIKGQKVQVRRDRDSRRRP